MARFVDGKTEDERPESGQTTAGLARLVLTSAALAGTVGVAAPAQAQEPAPAAPKEAAAPSPQGRLIDQARYWSRNGRLDLAQQSLQRLLKAEPNNAEGLYEMARLHLARGDAAGAQGYADRLRKLVGNGGLSEQLRKEMDIATLDNKALQQARNLVAQGEFATALQIYDRALAGRTLVGELAIEYYQTMAGVETRWAEARANLARLLAGSPKDQRLRLALARIETYRPDTRRGAIATLLDIAKVETEREAALDAARDGLQWLDTKKEDEPLFAAYARFRPDDQVAVAPLARLEKPTEQDQAAAARARGFSLLEQDRVDDAEDEFSELVKADGKDLEALLGLGIVLTRKGEFAEAIDILRRAVRLDEQKRDDFRRALAAAEFGADIQSVRRSIDAGDYPTAKAALDRLKPENAGDRAQTAIVQGEIAVLQKDLPGAERHYREALDLAPGNETALAGLLDALVEQKAGERLQAALAKHGGRVESPRARAAQAKARGYLALARKDTETAIAQYQEALAATPSDPWARLAVARALRDGGRLGEARALFDGVERGGDVGLIHAAALFAFESRDWGRTELLLAMTPPERRSAEMARLAAHARIQIGVDRSLLAASVGDTGEARRSLLALYSPGATTADETMLIGSALLELGDARTAASLVRQGLQALPDADIGDIANAARLLTAAGDHDGAQTLLDGLQDKVWELGDAERLILSAIYDNLLVARARAAITERDFARALDLVGPVYDANPAHAGALRALGEINVRAGRRDEGLRFYQSALDIDAADIDALRGAVGALTEMRRYDDALEMIEEATLRMAPSPELYLLQADVHKASGNMKRALEAMETAQRTRRPGPNRLALALGDVNPFRQAGRMPAAPPNPDAAPPARPVNAEARAAISPIDFRTPAQERREEAITAAHLMRRAAATTERAVMAMPTVHLVAERETTAFMMPAIDFSEPAQLRIAPPAGLLEAKFEPIAQRTAPRIVLAQAQSTQGATIKDRLRTIGAPGVDPAQEDGGASGARRRDLNWEIAALRSETGFSASEQFGFRWREGEEGLGQLTEFKLPLTLGFALGGGRLNATAEPVFLSAGELGKDPLKLRRVGALASVIPEQRSVVPADDAGGVGLGLAYAIAGFSVDIGTTPLGFEMPNIVGGISYAARLGEGFALQGSLSRRAVADSVLSYAGLQDPVSGDTFGAVTDSRLRLGGSYTTGGATFYVNGAGIVREGENVDSNTGAQLDTGVSMQLGAKFRSGFNLTYLGFEESLRHFTFGHGGYFSPQTFVSATIPLNYEHKSARLTVNFDNAVGIQYFEEDGSALFPDRTDLTARARTVALAEAAALPPQTKLLLGYDPESRTNLAFRTSVKSSYRLNEALSLQAGLSVDRAADWTEAVGMVGLTFVPSVR
jgi:tetratricopeptide (TPR) repeat protein